MNIIGIHHELHVRDLAAARHFYVDQLGLPLLQDTPALALFAVRVGISRLTVFGDREGEGQPGPLGIIVAVEDLDDALEHLAVRGVVAGKTATTGDFCRFVEVADPEGNVLSVAQYFRLPILAA